MMFENYEAMSAYGTWFSGILTAIAVFVSVIITSSSIRKRIRITLDVSKEGFTIGILNESKDPFLLQDLGVYLGGKMYRLIEKEDCFIKPGETRTFQISKDDWNKLEEQLLCRINFSLNNSLYMQTLRLLKREELFVDGDTLQRKLKFQYVSFKMGVQSSDALYTTRKWLTLPMFDTSNQREFQGPDHCYGTCRNIAFDSSILSMMITSFIAVLGLIIYYNGSYSAMILYVILTVALYFDICFESQQKIHPASYYTVWCVIMGLCISALLHMTVCMPLYSSILVETVLWIFMICGILPKMLTKAGLIGY